MAARRFAKKPLTIRTTEEDGEWSYKESMKGGPCNRGKVEGMYTCSACDKKDHDACEKLGSLFCGCYRYKHKPPKTNTMRSWRDGLTDTNVKVSKAKAKIVEDEEEWEEF